MALKLNVIDREGNQKIIDIEEGSTSGMLSTMCCFQIITVSVEDVVPAGHAMFMLELVILKN